MPDSLPIVGLHHIARVTRHLETTIDFYCGVLGFEELRRPPFSFRGAWLYNYGVQIHIIENEALAGERNQEIDSRANHLAFRVADMEPVKSLLETHEIEYIERVNAGGIQQIFFQDPDGHHIEIAVTGDPSIGYTGE